jgi:penicillin amidase
VFMGRDGYDDFRTRRIRALLAGARQTPASFGKIQLDVTSAFAQAILPQMLALGLPANDPAQAALALLRNWHGEMTMDAPQPLIFNAWTREMLSQTLRASGFDPAEAPVLDNNFLYALLGPGATDAARNMWCDGDCSALLRRSLNAAYAALQSRYGSDPGNWRWGATHQAVFAHPILGSLPIIDRLTRFMLSVPGDASTIDLADLDRSLFIIAPGQSGNLLSPHASDMLRRWRSGQYIQLGAMPFPASRWITMLAAPQIDSSQK